jgi:hypothetical protein
VIDVKVCEGGVGVWWYFTRLCVHFQKSLSV